MQYFLLTTSSCLRYLPTKITAQAEPADKEIELFPCWFFFLNLELGTVKSRLMELSAAVEAHA